MRILLCALALMTPACVRPAFAVGTYGATVSNATSVTITNSQHGFNSKYFGVHVYDADSIRVQPGGSPGYSYSINPSTYAATVTFGSSFTGTVVLTGPFAGVTSANRDFAVSVGVDSGNGFMKVCGDCTQSDYALRSWSGKSWYSAGATTLTLTSAAGGGTWRAWLEDQKVVFGFSFGAPGGAAYCDGMPCEVRFNVSDYPAGAVRLGSCGRSGVAGQHWVGSPSDDRQ